MANILSRFLFPRYLWWVWLLVPLTLFAFYPTYFSKLGVGTPPIMHWHAGFMLLWIGLLILQPWLIITKRIRLHRITGKASFIIMPMVLITAWLMMRFSYEAYYLQPAMQKLQRVTLARRQALMDMRIGVLYWLWLLTFYTLGMVCRKKVLPHSTYLFAALLTLLGPTVDRIMFRVYTALNMSIDFAILTFVIIDVLLLALAVFHYKRGLNTRPALTAVGIYLLGQLLYYLAPHFFLWQLFLDPFSADRLLT